MTESPEQPRGRTAVVILAAGSGRRVGAATNKVLLPLDGMPVLAHSVRTALTIEGVRRLLVVIRPEDRDEVSAALAPHLGDRELWLIDGGAERHDSEMAALSALGAEIESGDIEVVAIHDSARPLATAALFRAAIEAAGAKGSAVPAIPAGVLSRADGTAPRSDLTAVQTPQAFTATALLMAYQAARADGFKGSDTAACLERYAQTRIHSVPGEPTNLKVTFPEDLAVATELLRDGLLNQAAEQRDPLHD